MKGTVADANELTLVAGALTGDRTVTLPDATGTVALTSDITGTNSGTNTGDEPDASTTVKGIIEIATATEAKAGTDALRAITPDTLAARSVHASIDVSDSSFTSNLYAEITHNLGTEDIIVQLFDSSTKETVYADIARTDKANSASTSKIKITFAAAPANDIEVLITSIKGSTAGTVAYS